MADPEKWPDDTWVSLCYEHFRRDYRAGLDSYSDADDHELMCQVDGCNQWATIEMNIGIVPKLNAAVKDLEEGKGIPLEDLKKRFPEGL